MTTFFFFSFLFSLFCTVLHAHACTKPPSLRPVLVPLSDLGRGSGEQTPAPPPPPGNAPRPVFAEKSAANDCAPAKPGAALLAARRNSRGALRSCAVAAAAPGARPGPCAPLRAPAQRCAAPRGLRRPLAGAARHCRARAPAAGRCGPVPGESAGDPPALTTVRSKEENKPTAGFNGTQVYGLV